MAASGLFIKDIFLTTSLTAKTRFVIFFTRRAFYWMLILKIKVVAPILKRQKLCLVLRIKK